MELGRSIRAVRIRDTVRRSALGLMILLVCSLAVANEDGHHLDGLSLTYYYQTGWAVSMSFDDGRMRYEWIAGPPQGDSNADLAYHSRKVGPNTYLINFHEADRSNFVTLLLNFDQNVMASSGILGYGADEELIHFEGGIIESAVVP